jgi:hypothetical protein
MTSVPIVDSRIARQVPDAKPELARQIVNDAIRRYFRKRRSKIPEFVERNYSFNGALETHRNALGHDLWRAPLNAALVGPAVALKGMAWGFDQAGQKDVGAWLRSREIFMRTDVAREIEWRLQSQLLELPFRDGQRVYERDALAAEILADPRVAGILDYLNGPWGERERLRLESKLSQSLAIYTNSRFAAGEIANLVMTSGIGAAALHQATPGVLTLGPALATWVAEHFGAAGVPHGVLIGLWHALIPASPGIGLTALATGSVLVATAAFSAVSGVVTDPLQKALGLHQRRLVALVDALERGFLGEDEAQLVTREQYVVRLAELLDLAVAAWRFAKG